jgi:hypothetical protein
MMRALIVSGAVLVSLTAGEAAVPAPNPAISAPVVAQKVAPVVAPVVAQKVAPIPPSPSTAPGVRIWSDPKFTHWPVVAYREEVRNVAFALPVKRAGANGTIGWAGQDPMPFTLPTSADSISGLLPLPADIGVHQAQVALNKGNFPISLRIADAREAWPLARLENGFPVDAQGQAVVLQDRRRGSREERVWSALDAGGVRPTGRAVLVGDPLEALGSKVWDGIDAEARVAIDERFPHHAVLVALSSILADGTGDLRQRLPRTIVWCPGNQTLHGGAWSEEEERVLGLVRTRCERLGITPRLVMALPPLPVDEHLQAKATERRDLLMRSANRLGWVVVDLKRAAGAPEEANRVAPQVFTTYPLAEAQTRMRAVLNDALK